MNVRKILIGLGVAGLLSGCQTQSVLVSVKNSLPVYREKEMLEIPIEKFPRFVQKEHIVVLDEQKNPQVYQKTHSNTLIFLVSVPPKSERSYTIQRGEPQKFVNKAQGRSYPERLDDMAWENDMMGFRAYGPALQQRGETSFGYDLFVKRGTELPVLEELYAKELDHATRKLSEDLKKTDPQRALALWRSISYHYDRGNGLDCYSVGATLGAGVTAFIQGDSIIYPYCYKTYKILDNGPLRFTVKLVFHPKNIAGEAVVEERLISLDVGSALNRTQVIYRGLSHPHRIASGVVLHDVPSRIQFSPDKRWASYVDPTNTPDKSNGEIFLGMVFPVPAEQIQTVAFSAEKIKRTKAYGHLLATQRYEPHQTYEYYWGAGWTKGYFPTEADWLAYLQKFQQQLDNPLQVTLHRKF